MKTIDISPVLESSPYLLELFGASYDPLLTKENRDYLVSCVILQIKGLASGIDKKLPKNELVQKLARKIDAYVLFEPNSLFAIDFALDGNGDAIVCNDLVVAGIEYLGRDDILEKMSIVRERHYGAPCVLVDVAGAENTGPSIAPLISCNWDAKGVVFGKKGKYEKARECFLESIKNDPSNINPIVNLGVVYGMEKEYGESLKLFESALEISPGDPEALNRKGTALFYLGRQDEALDCFEIVLAFDPGNANALKGKSFVQSRKQAA